MLLVARVVDVALSDGLEIDILCNFYQERCKHIHEQGKHPCVSETDAAIACGVTIHLGVVETHERYANGKDNEE